VRVPVAIKHPPPRFGGPHARNDSDVRELMLRVYYSFQSKETKFYPRPRERSRRSILDAADDERRGVVHGHELLIHGLPNPRARSIVAVASEYPDLNLRKCIRPEVAKYALATFISAKINILNTSFGYITTKYMSSSFPSDGL